MNRVVPGVLLLAAIAFVVGIGCKAYERNRDCNQYGLDTGQQSEWRPYVGCTVKQGEFWVIKR